MITQHVSMFIETVRLFSYFFREDELIIFNDRLHVLLFICVIKYRICYVADPRSDPPEL